MPRAPRQCPTPGCDNRITTTRYCDEHTIHHWKPRSHTAEHGHQAWRSAVLRRDKGLCKTQGPHCTHRATEADHITPVAEGGARYDITNGAAICSPCHKAKTQAEATRGLRRRYGRR
ncbi:HNH endonuclease [Microbacterium oxydans]|uniref:HNH endonuclease n=1 Tax=Microbacterium oxydans TaxID=82380 RepID=UPI003B001948